MLKRIWRWAATKTALGRTVRDIIDTIDERLCRPRVRDLLVEFWAREGALLVLKDGYTWDDAVKEIEPEYLDMLLDE